MSQAQVIDFSRAKAQRQFAADLKRALQPRANSKAGRAAKQAQRAMAVRIAASTAL